MNLYRMCILVGLLGFIVSCTSIQPGDTRALSPLISPLAPTDAAAEEIVPAVLVELPEPSVGQATVGGRLLAQFESDGELEPVPRTAIYLAEVLMTQDGRPGVASLDNLTAPGSSTDPEGVFVFTDAPEGVYALMIFHGVSFSVIKDENGKDVVITVEPDQIIDLGVIKTKLPRM